MPSARLALSIPNNAPLSLCENIPGMLMDLFEFALMRRDGHTGGIEDNKPRAGGSLVNSADEALLEIIGTMFLILN